MNADFQSTSASNKAMPPLLEADPEQSVACFQCSSR